MHEHQAHIVFAPFLGESLELAASIVERGFTVVREQAIFTNDLVQVRNTQEQGGFIVLAVAEGLERPVIRGALPVSIDGGTGVLRTRLVETNRYTQQDRSSLSHGLVVRALRHLGTMNEIDRVRVEAPTALQSSYAPHGLTVGATIDLSVVHPAIERSSK